jgi:hypothetical protein
MSGLILCAIVQDSEEDWEHESSLMGETYSSALLTIIASGAEDGNQGCFVPRTASDVDPVIIDFVGLYER